MCGIVGYTGSHPALSRVIEGLRRLEYRGYDSAGIALVGKTGDPLVVAKKAGKLINLEGALTSSYENSTSGIGHTRWATHGGPTDTNAHPHISNDGKLAVIHNGIIENYVELKTDLQNVAMPLLRRLTQNRLSIYSVMNSRFREILPKPCVWYVKNCGAHSRF